MSTTPEVMSLAEKVEAVIHTTFTQKNDGLAFDLPKAMLVGINVTETGEVRIEPELASHGDIYRLIDSVEKSTVQGFDALGLVTCGWAAPIAQGQTEPDVAPSEHAQRRRVRLFACVTRNGMASVLRFQDDAENVITDEGQASGPLADAVLALFED